MTKPNEIYKCSICGNVVEVIEAHEGILVCCGQNMKLLEEKTTEQEGKEKHVPVIEIEGDKVKVRVGSIEHPMETEHHIELIDILKNGKVIAGKQLLSGEKPEAEFCCLESTEGIKARALCNVHGLWVS